MISRVAVVGAVLVLIHSVACQKVYVNRPARYFVKKLPRMLRLEDLDHVFGEIPRDFVVRVGSSEHRFSRILLSSFSSVVRSLGPDCLEWVLPFEVSAAAVEEVKLFIHGKSGNFSLCPFDCFLVAASLNLKVLIERLERMIVETMTLDNFRQRFDLLTPFPDFLGPLALFVSKDPSFFNSFAEGHLFPPSILAVFLSCDALWNNVEEKLQFAFGHGSGDWQPLFFGLKIDDISEKSLHRLISARTETHSFSVLLFLCRVRARLQSELDGLETVFTVEVETKYDDVSSLNTRLKKDGEVFWEDLLFRKYRLSDLERALKSEAVRIEGLLLSLERVQEVNIQFANLCEHVTELAAACDELCRSTGSFHKVGKVIYPTSSPESVDHSSMWRKLVIGLKEMVEPIVMPKDVIEEIRNRLVQLQREIEGFFPAIG